MVIFGVDSIFGSKNVISESSELSSSSISAKTKKRCFLMFLSPQCSKRLHTEKNKSDLIAYTSENNIMSPKYIKSKNNNKIKQKTNSK